MVEPEIAYGTLDDLMELAEGLLTFLIKQCLDRRRPDLATIGRDLARLEKIEAPFPRITYVEPVTKFQEGHAQAKLENKFKWGADLSQPAQTFPSPPNNRPSLNN